MLFADIPGLTSLKSTLINAVKSNHLAHAQLFYGKEGTANMALALALATYVNCENPGEVDSCGVCSSCVKMKKLAHPDLHMVFPKPGKQEKDEEKAAMGQKFREFTLSNIFGNFEDWAKFIESENKQLNIGVQESRNLNNVFAYKPFEGNYKVCILYLPEFMNPSSANALLKLLEEPNDHSLFILVSADLEKLLLTIKSRTQLVSVPIFSEDDIANYLVGHNVLAESDAENVANLADGNMRQALLLSQHTENDNLAFFRNWMLAAFKKDISGIFKFADGFQKLGKEGQKSVLLYGLNILRNCLIISANQSQLVKLAEKEKEFVSKFAGFIKGDNIGEIVGIMNESHYYIERNANPRILFVDISLKISKLLG